MRYVFVILLIVGSAGISNAQRRAAWYVRGHLENATGQYKTYLTDVDALSPKFGLNAGFLVNPKKSSLEYFPITIGGEFGFTGLGTSSVPSQIGGSFTEGSTAYWLNFVSRYRPFVGLAKLNPFMEVQVGPKLHSTRVLEQVSVEEVLKIAGLNSWSKNYGIGVGFDWLYNPKKQTRNHIEVAVYYFHGEATRRLIRGRSNIDAAGFVNTATGIVPSHSWQIRFGIISFD